MRILGQTIPFCVKCHIIEFNVNEKPNKVSKCSRNKLKKEKKDMKRVCIKLLRKNITYPYPIFCFFFIFYFFIFIFIFFNFSKLPKVHQRGEKKKKKILHMHLSDTVIFKTFKYNNIN